MRTRIILSLALIFYSINGLAEVTRKSGFDFVDMIYCINLPQSIDRKQHIIEEFNRVGIKNYQLFVATDKDSPEVKKIMKSDFVKKYPPCFRCNQVTCDCFNNVLIKHQIGNWLSFINIFRDIVKNNYEYAMITEDDVKFTDDAVQILNKLINQETFAKYNINSNEPVLIKLAGEKEQIATHDINDIKFTKCIRLSNACFIVNRKFAESFLKNLKQIDTTSDVFIHHNLLRVDRSIQSFAAYPKPSYQLSSGKTPTFYSTIHPKGIDTADAARKKNHKMRIEYWEYLIGKLAFWSYG